MAKRKANAPRTPHFKYFSFSACTSLAKYGQLNALPNSSLNRPSSPPARSLANLTSHPNRLYNKRMLGWINTDNRRLRTTKYASTRLSPRCCITYAIVTVALRDTPTRQCTNTRPPVSRAFSIQVQTGWSWGSSVSMPSSQTPLMSRTLIRPSRSSIQREP